MTETRQGVRDLNAPTWRYLRFASSYGFILPEHLLEVIVAELLSPSVAPDDPSQEWPPEQDKRISYAYIDQPGMCSIGRPNEIFDLAGLRLEIPCEDVSAFAGQLGRIKVQQLRVSERLGMVDPALASNEHPEIFDSLGEMLQTGLR